jgi:hypothetical protein
VHHFWAAASVPTSEPGWVSYLGPFIPFAVITMWGLVVLYRQLQAERAARDADREAAAQTIREKDQRIEALSDRVVEQAERNGPLLTEATNALSEAARELSRRPRP